MGQYSNFKPQRVRGGKSLTLPFFFIFYTKTARAASPEYLTMCASQCASHLTMHTEGLARLQMAVLVLLSSRFIASETSLQLCL